MFVFKSLSQHSALRQAITAAYRMDETACVAQLLNRPRFSKAQQDHVQHTATQLINEVRQQRTCKSGMDAFLQQYDFSSEEAIALMCLAEALMRVPDTATIDQLIRDKLAGKHWQQHIGQSDSLFINATTWGLMLTGKLLSADQTAGHFTTVLQRLLAHTGEPVIRKAVTQAMHILGDQFVQGRDINEAIQRADEKTQLGYRLSYDMLGEAAQSAADAERYFQAYQQALTVVANLATAEDWPHNPALSVKLSALHPRFEFAQQDTALPVVCERLLALASQAKAANISLCVDAEEADRLDIMLDVFAAVFASAELTGWDGLGLAVQAYQKRALSVIAWLEDLSQNKQRRIPLRLVKGAYWDSEIKTSQVLGLEGYPVFTRKGTTDVSYLACAQQMIAAKAAFYPQFATHNAYTVAAIMDMMGKRTDFEFQCLKGMGRALYDQIISAEGYRLSCRAYAPVGSYQELLPYLMRRLLENGANTSFINRIADEQAPIERLVADPVAELEALTDKPHPRIVLPSQLFGRARVNSLDAIYARMFVPGIKKAEVKKQ